jgi:hypothetical protein
METKMTATFVAPVDILLQVLLVTRVTLVNPLLLVPTQVKTVCLVALVKPPLAAQNVLVVSLAHMLLMIKKLAPIVWLESTLLQALLK